uniref:rRNA biogenesis protein RRP36 n=2 Tax=Daphnia TaxID=6668 RepID=A0A4Y7MV45_DAPPU|nr:EOG090X0E8U [Daphnia pulex]SVE84527.1 EOG090X0E8U [Daphnia pulex]SVE85150.1 EOG090X0E8U [Daphnia pulex]SVE85777.1 EOG090X0E8U [Daphnia pulicaria]
MSKKWKVENLVEEASDTEESDVEQDEERPLKSSDDDEDELSGLDIPEAKLPVLRSIGSERGEEAEKLAIREELSALTFEELQKLKEKIGSKKFNQTLIGVKKKPQVRTDFKRANPNRPREISSKSRRIEPKVAIQVPKVFRSDPRFDNLCGEFHEKKFYKNYDFVNKMKEDEVKKLKEELREETNPRRTEKIKYLIQRMENQIRSEKMRKLEEEKQEEEKQITIDALKEGKSPYFATKAARKERNLKEKFDSLKEEGRLNQYMAKKRKHNAQRDRRHMPSEDY